VGWQVAAVERALESADVAPLPPNAYRGVRLEGKRSIRALVTARPLLDEAAVQRLTRILATAFPPK
jgi:hypothetical protein